MTSKTISILILFFLSFHLYGQKSFEEKISTHEALEDLTFLDEKLQSVSSYQGLNGFDYRPFFNDYINAIKGDSVSKKEMGIFLSKTIGQIGDRHSSVRKFDLPDEIEFPFSVAPYKGKVVALRYERPKREFNFFLNDYPYLTAINGMNTLEFLSKINPRDNQAPAASALNRHVSRLRDIEESFAMAEIPLPEVLELQFSGEGKDTLIKLVVSEIKKSSPRWEDKLSLFAKDEKELNDVAIAQKHFNLDENNIGYIHIPDMVNPYIAPNYFHELNLFMEKAKDSKALIVDIRGNGGGTRELIMELAKYFVHPDSVHVVNLAKLRTDQALEFDEMESLNYKFLYPYNELTEREKIAVDDFMKSFEPIYKLPEEKFSEYYYCIFNGKKLSHHSFHYDKPIYILTNERSFSAASILASLFKDLPNIKLAGVTTDGSSGRSKYIYLPNSKIRVKLSTMVSFQKDGRVLDGYGTDPDIIIERSLEQIMWREDYQLKKLKEIIVKSEE